MSTGVLGFVTNLFGQNQMDPLQSRDEGVVVEAQNAVKVGDSVPEIRSTALEFFTRTPPPPRYIELKGQPTLESRGYLCGCTIFADSGPPPDTLGSVMDIYLDLGSKSIFSHRDGPNRWRQWLNTATVHSNPLFPEFELVAQHRSGIRWGTRNSFLIDQARYSGVVSIEDCVNLTLACHPQLALDGPDLSMLLAQLKIKWTEDANDKPEEDDGEERKSNGEHNKKRKRDAGDDEEGVGVKMREEVGSDEGVFGTPKRSKNQESTNRSQGVRAAKKGKTKDPRSEGTKGKRKRALGGGDKLKKKQKTQKETSQTNTRSPQKITITIPAKAPHFTLPSTSRALDTHPAEVSHDSPHPRDSIPPAVGLTPEKRQTIPPFQQLRDAPEGWLSRAGKEFPKTATIAKWVSGISIVTPWMTDAKENDNPDVDAVNHMASAPDVTNPDDIRATPGDERLESFNADPVVVVVHWTYDLQSPQSTRSDFEVTGFNQTEIDTHREKYEAWLQVIETHLAAGRIVAVRGWKPNATTTWDVASISKFKGSMSQPVEYQDATARARSYHSQRRTNIHKTTTFEDFIEKGTRDPMNSGNCLDSPGLRAEYPPFILPFADCTRALELTRMDNGVQLPLCAEHGANEEVDTWIAKLKRKVTGDTKTRCGRCQDIAAMRSRLLEQHNKDLVAEDEDDETAPHHGESGQSVEYAEVEPPNPATESSSLGWKGHIAQFFYNFGFFTVSWDAWKSCIWDLFTHAGFFTYVHHDAGGFATYAFVREGCKIWGIHRPMVNETHHNRSKVYDVMRGILREHGILDYMPRTELYSFFLMKGDVLIQPPNTIHQVYTPINCIASGGHFYSWCMLHLTEWSRRYDFFYSHLATNADHESAFRYMCRMATSLKYACRSRKFLRRPILSLMLMILKPADYEPHRLDSSTRAGLSGWDLMRLETQADHACALKIVNSIMKRYKLDVEEIEKELDVGGVDWAKAGEEVIDLAFLAKVRLNAKN